VIVIATISSVFLYGINIYMIVQSIHSSWDMVYNQYRNTEFKTLVDPVSHKKIIEIVQYLYDKTGQIEPTNTKGNNVDTKA
jgi:hypothetical protein